MDFLIFFKNKIFLSIFWREIWWDVVKHPNTPFLQLWWGSWVPTSREVAWSAIKTKSMVLPPWTPTKTNFNFFDNHCKGKVFAKIFCVERLFPTCLVWVLQPFEWTQLGFLAFAKIVFSPLNDVTGAHNLPRKLRFCLTVDSLAQSVQKLWLFEARRVKMWPRGT